MNQDRRTETTTGPRKPKRTSEEQRLLEDMVRLGGMSQEEVDRKAELILIQARMVGDL